MNSISHAAMPVLNAFCLVALVWGVFAVLAVQLYSDISVRTDFGYFDTFTEALQTLFQVFPLHIAPDLYCSHSPWPRMACKCARRLSRAMAASESVTT